MSQVLVKATRMGYYADKRQREGDEFFMDKELAQGCSWIELMEDQPKPQAKPQAKKKGITAPLPNPMRKIEDPEPQNQEVI